MEVILKYTLGWAGLVMTAILNGAVREKGYGQRMNELGAHQLSTVIGLFLFALYIWILTGIWRIQSAEQALAIGGVWLALTILFEFIFGHYVMGHPWDRLFRDYNLFKGRLWVLILLWTTVSPYVFYKLR